MAILIQCDQCKKSQPEGTASDWATLLSYTPNFSTHATYVFYESFPITPVHLCSKACILEYSLAQHVQHEAEEKERQAREREEQQKQYEVKR